MGHAMITGRCANCGNPVSFMYENAELVNSIPILPETGLPVDVQVVNGKPAPREFTEEELERARQNRQPLCLNCAERLADNMRAKGLTPPTINYRAYDIPA